MKNAISLLACFLFLSSEGLAQNLPTDFNTKDLWSYDSAQVKIENGMVTLQSDGSCLMVYNGKDFSTGEIEFDLRGRDVFQHSFLGLAFNIQSKETYGDGNIYDYGFRIYNPRLGKFLSVDPLNKFYPMLTPYQFTSNRPIDGVDLDGLEYLSNEDARFKYINGLTVIDLENNGDIVKSKIESAQNSNFDNRSLTQIDNVGTFGLATFEINPADFEGTWLDMPHIAEGGSLSLSPQTGIKYYFQSYDNNYNNTNVGKSPARLNLADENYELRFVKMNRLNRASNAVALVQGVDWLLKFRSNYIFKKNMRQLDAQYYKYAKLINSML